MSVNEPTLNARLGCLKIALVGAFALRHIGSILQQAITTVAWGNALSLLHTSQQEAMRIRFKDSRTNHLPLLSLVDSQSAAKFLRATEKRLKPRTKPLGNL